MGGEVVDARELRGAHELRRRTVARFLEDLGSAGIEEKEVIDDVIRHMYSPDLKNGWWIHLFQEVKLLAKKKDRFALDLALNELIHLGMQSFTLYLAATMLQSSFPNWSQSGKQDMKHV
ncbi:hypothetical protein Fmac_020414 [Flemingia macrophylla]|uniref:Uncharacterized protein n=1 Tax=Flemingia macrophylla TaxID=520843 RepID=A0ABD1LU11_9FABA